MAWAVVAGAAITTVGGALMSRKGNKAQDAAASAANLEAEIARDQWERYKQVYAPLEEQFVAESFAYDTPQNYALAAGEASADVSTQFGKMRQRLNRTPGLDPSSPAYQASMVNLDLSQAATDATMQNRARLGVRDTAYDRKRTALALGKGLDQTAASGAGRSANTLGNLAAAQYGQASDAATGLGSLTSNLINAWQNRKPATTTPGGP